MGRSSFEKSIDARHEGFNAVDAFNEQAFEPRKSILKKTKKKEGLKDYSEKEVAKMSGEVKSVSLYSPCTWKEFRSYDKAIQVKYILSLIKLYPDINAVDLSYMFKRDNSTISNYLNSIGIRFPRGGRGLTDSRISFRKKYSSENVDESVNKSKEISNDITCKSEEENVVNIFEVKFACDVDSVSDILKRYGFSGRVRITVER